MRNRLNTLPTLVIRGSHSEANWSVASACHRIVRNLNMRNGLLPFPTRVCENITGPLLSSLIIMATTRQYGIIKGRDNRTMLFSYMLFTSSYPGEGSNDPKLFSDILWILTLPVIVSYTVLAL